jgi:hypothetical protein
MLRIEIPGFMFMNDSFMNGAADRITMAVIPAVPDNFSAKVGNSGWIPVRRRRLINNS